MQISSKEGWPQILSFMHHKSSLAVSSTRRWNTLWRSQPAIAAEQDAWNVLLAVHSKAQWHAIALVSPG
jgi:hypothetical protein